jgi:hypothetical protein
MTCLVTVMHAGLPAAHPAPAAAPLHRLTKKGRRLLKDYENEPEDSDEYEPEDSDEYEPKYSKDCRSEEIWIQCNSTALCSAIGWSAPTAAMGTECDCIDMCKIAQSNAGLCLHAWNKPTTSYYYSLQYDGAVICGGPRRGGGGRKGAPVPYYYING